MKDRVRIRIWLNVRHPAFSSSISGLGKADLLALCNVSSLLLCSAYIVAPQTKKKERKFCKDITAFTALSSKENKIEQWCPLNSPAQGSREQKTISDELSKCFPYVKRLHDRELKEPLNSAESFGNIQKEEQRWGPCECTIVYNVNQRSNFGAMKWQGQQRGCQQRKSQNK